MKIFVTGSAGFIGFHLCKKLLEAGHNVVGVDSLSSYYDVNLKKARHILLMENDRFIPEIFDLVDRERTREVLRKHKPTIVIHLAAQAGVRYSIEHPEAYVDSNLVGSCNLLEGIRDLEIQHFLFASTSSVYGASTDLPYAEMGSADRPLSFYAATKRAVEMISHSYSHLHGIPTTCFRFFTVYGPWGRPDMALFKFTDAIIKGEPIEIYNHGEMLRDFTYVEDLVKAIQLLVSCKPVIGEDVGENDTLSPVAPWRVVNIGNSRSERLTDFVEILERELMKKAHKTMLPIQPGDVPATWADCNLLERLTGYRPATRIDEGIRQFVSWYTEFYGQQT